MRFQRARAAGELAARHANNAIMATAAAVAVCYGFYAPAYHRLTPSDYDFDLISRVAAGEARSRPRREQAAVCHVMLNRVRLGTWGTWDDTLMARKQFSPMNESDPNYRIVMHPDFPETRAYKRAWNVCTDAINGRLQGEIDDPTKGADHFHSGPKKPWWARGKRPVVRIGAFRFYRLRS